MLLWALARFLLLLWLLRRLLLPVLLLLVMQVLVVRLLVLRLGLLRHCSCGAALCEYEQLYDCQRSVQLFKWLHVKVLVRVSVHRIY